MIEIKKKRSFDELDFFGSSSRNFEFTQPIGYL